MEIITALSLCIILVYALKKFHTRNTTSKVVTGVYINGNTYTVPEQLGDVVKLLHRDKEVGLEFLRLSKTLVPYLFLYPVGIAKAVETFLESIETQVTAYTAKVIIPNTDTSVKSKRARVEVNNYKAFDVAIGYIEEVLDILKDPLEKDELKRLSNKFNLKNEKIVCLAQPESSGNSNNLNIIGCYIVSSRS